jgi:hypothetical protein
MVTFRNRPTYLIMLVMLTGIGHTSRCIAQDSTEVITPKRGYMRLAIGPSMAPTFNYRLLANTDGNSDAVQLIEGRDMQEIMSILTVAGLTSCYMMNRDLGVEFGLFYALQGYESERIPFKLSPPNLPIYSRKRYRFTYFDIQMRVNHLFGKGKARMLTVAGFATSVLINGITYYDWKYDKGIHTRELNTECAAVNFSPIIGWGLHWGFSPYVAIRILPTFRFGVVPITTEYYNTFTYSGALEVTILFGE